MTLALRGLADAEPVMLERCSTAAATSSNASH